MPRVKKRKLPGGINPVDILNGINSNKSRPRVPAPRTGVYEITSSPPERERPQREPQRKRHQTRSRRTGTEVTEDAALDRAQSEPREQDQIMNDASESELEPEQDGNFEQPNNEDSRRDDEVRFPGFEEFDSSDDEQDEPDEQGEQASQEEEGNLRIFGSDEAEELEDSDEPHEPEESDEQSNPETQYRDEEGSETEELVQGSPGQEESEQEEPQQQYPENDDEVNENEASQHVSQPPSPPFQVVMPPRSGQIAEGAGHNNSPNDSHIIQPASRGRGQRRKKARVVVVPRPELEHEPEREPQPEPEHESEPEPRRGDRRNGNPKPRREPSPPPPPPEYFNEMSAWFSQTVQHTIHGKLWEDLYKQASELRKRNCDSMPSRFEDAHALLFRLRDLYLDIDDQPEVAGLPAFFTDDVAKVCSSSLEAIQLSLDFPSIPDKDHDPGLAGELILSFEEDVLPHVMVPILLALRTYILFGTPAKAPFLGILQLVVDCCTYIDMLRPYYETNRNRQRSWKLGICARDIKRQLAKGTLLDLLPADSSETVKEDRERAARGPDERWTDEKEGEFADVWSELETRQSANRYMHIKTRFSDKFSQFSIRDLMLKAREIELG